MLQVRLGGHTSSPAESALRGQMLAASATRLPYSADLGPAEHLAHRNNALPPARLHPARRARPLHQPPTQQTAITQANGHRVLARCTWSLKIDVSAIAYGAMSGYGVGPPSLRNPSI